MVDYDIQIYKQKFTTNQQIIKIFESFKSFQKGYNFKKKAYQNAINKISKLDYQITKSNVSKLLKDHIVGKKLYMKIIEYLNTSKVEELNQLLEKSSRPDNLLLVKGFGPKTVEKFNEKGIYTIEDLLQFPDLVNKLTHIQLLGIKYHYDLIQSIPRQEITKIFQILDKNIFKKLKVKAVLVGSYRRGKSESGDIDIIISSNENILSQLHKMVTHCPIFIEDIIFGNVKYSFLVKSFGSVIRQVDILVVPTKSYYTALLHFTGDASFNEAIRSIAKRKGTKINEYYLQKGSLKIYPKSEKEIFSILGIKYLQPCDRTSRNVIVI